MNEKEEERENGYWIGFFRVKMEIGIREMVMERKCWVGRNREERNQETHVTFDLYQRIRRLWSAGGFWVN
jgi:hypothetical protein